MIIFPAIDLFDKKAVRLYKGDYQNMTVYSENPIEIARDFENAGATMSGVETAYRAMKKRGKIDETYKFIAFGGDGGTYDIGFQSLSGAMERGHDMVYVCYDNEAYMNTGIQRSSSTPHFADTTTTPAGTVVPGKMQQKKNYQKNIKILFKIWNLF